ncbi:hypothetical protein TW85_13120 [Marinomonas sp. S3726]|uniref:hypothetical protein n=1 Tax=Marinomonas sp. S3726 TaxID=579484 RepID=UPI0005FA057A|nr:hypothetical protein [Marinomonas sp. S3726]KJZ13631.1 hypothetical protein TW85_13120 [Marinomonas sp. S3726]
MLKIIAITTLRQKLAVIIALFVLCTWSFVNYRAISVERIDSSMVSIKRGVSYSAECRESRGVAYKVDFYVLYDQEAQAYEDTFNIACDEGLLKKFNSSVIEISFYKNNNLSLKINNEVLVPIDQAIFKRNNKGQRIFTITSMMAFFVIIMLFFWSRPLSK